MLKKQQKKKSMLSLSQEYDTHGTKTTFFNMNEQV